MKLFIKILLINILWIFILSHGLYGQTYYYGFNEKIHIDQQANKYIAECDAKFVDLESFIIL
ncbi:MAG: hypothetical protein U9N51_05845 [Bacteroidota bacterium]|nr:hypothetical protein [Bacteroidota bacterium]